MSPDSPAPNAVANVALRARWLKTVVRWHWVSSAICLIGMLLFALTGITLNHASQIEARPHLVHFEGQLPTQTLDALRSHDARVDARPPEALREWLRAEWGLRVPRREAEWSGDELYLALPRPGGDAWLSVDLDSGDIEYERSDRGSIAYLNDLHKGRNTGPAWGWFIDVFAVACVVFCLTGLLLLHQHARARASTWPLVALGVVLPLLLILLFVH